MDPVVRIADMVGAVRDGRPPVLTGEQSRASLEVVPAICESARTGRVQRLPLRLSLMYTRRRL